MRIQFVSDNIGHITSAPHHFADLDFHFYRPLTILTLAFDYAIWGLQPFGFHLTNLILHLMAIVLVYLFAIRLTGTRIAAVVSSLFFGLHPIHSMSIFWISGRVDIVCTLFYLGSLIYLMNFVRTRRRSQMALSLVLFICALASKEMALSMPLVVGAYLLVFSKDRSSTGLKRFIFILLPYVVITLLYFLLKYSFVGSDAYTTGAHFNTNPVHLLKNVAMFGGFLVVPGYHLEFGAYLQSHRSLFVALAAAALAALLISFRWLIRSQCALFGVLFMIMTLLPVIRLAMRWYMYLPSVGFCLLLGYLASGLWERFNKKVPLIGGIVLLAATYAVFLLNQQSNWVTAGQIANKVSAEVASTVHDKNITSGFVLTVPAEINQTPILIFGLGSNINAEIKHLDSVADLVDIRPILLISLANEEDYSRCRVERTKDGSFEASLEATESYFVFPEDLELVSGSRSLRIGDTIRADAFAVIIDNINASGEANSVTVRMDQNDFPVLLFKDESFRVVSIREQ